MSDAVNLSKHASGKSRFAKVFSGFLYMMVAVTPLVLFGAAVYKMTTLSDAGHALREYIRKNPERWVAYKRGIRTIFYDETMNVVIVQRKFYDGEYEGVANNAFYIENGKSQKLTFTRRDMRYVAKELSKIDVGSTVSEQATQKVIDMIRKDSSHK